MNDDGTSGTLRVQETIALRPETAGDEAFLCEVYGGTREEELNLTGWDAATRAAFVDMQFKAMRQAYKTEFATAEFAVVLRGGERIGLMVIHRTDERILVVDLALRASQRNLGIGTLLMRRVCAEADAVKKPVRLCVVKNNRAIQWYERMGFKIIGEMGFYDELEKQPDNGLPPRTAPMGP